MHYDNWQRMLEYLHVGAPSPLVVCAADVNLPACTSTGGGSPRRAQRLSLGSHFISGVWTTLAQLMEVNPLRCRGSLMVVLLHLHTPAFLQSVMDDPNWGTECLSLCWSICKIVIRDLQQVDASDILIMRTFECMSTVWPRVVRSMTPGLDAQDLNECSAWFLDFLLWGLYPKPAALRRWEGVLTLLVAGLPGVLQRGRAKLPASVLQKVAPTARKVLSCQHTSSPAAVTALTKLCEDAAAIEPKKCVAI
jgi:hypothetical protein